VSDQYDRLTAEPGADPDDLDAALAPLAKPVSHPQGWEPGVAWDGAAGTLTTGPLVDPPDPAIWAELIADWGLDPGATEVVPGSVQVRGWDANVGAGVIKRLRYYRATIRQRTASEEQADVDSLCRRASRMKPVRQPAAGGPFALVVPLSDWQIGKGENGGTEATVERICNAIDAIDRKVKAMRRAGRAPEAIYLAGMGDLVEQCDGHYPMQAFQADLDRRQQKRVARRLLLRAVDRCLGLAPRVVMCSVPGNHGENRKDGKAFTTWTDNDDLAIFEEVAEVLAANAERYESVSTVLARDLTLVLSVAGVNVGFAHGHQFGRGQGHPAGKAQKWWEGQIMGRQPVADCDLLFTGHYHHLLVSETSGRTHIQLPSMDGGSYWFTSQTGQHSQPGQLFVGVGIGYGPRGWGDLEVVS
jgi:hypothetical protein